ncbi:MAG TPA: antitoxin VapB family protein [Candidatus Lokiarchaeia archaeon]|nr:antitoxin VapB family protein [Candidatus Lokiarchaeia archaeon]
MTSKTISVTEDVYRELQKYKGKNESFSEFFKRLLDLQRSNLERSFGAWKLTKDEEDLFEDSIQRPARRWKRTEAGVDS